MSDSRDLWARLIANGKPERWKRTVPARKAAKRTETSAPGASERDVLRLLQDAAPLLDAQLWRNNVGVLQDRHGRYVTYGLEVGSSDLIGYSVVTVTPDMVGQQLAVFLAVEGKREVGGTVSSRQGRFLERVKAAGGLAGVARSVEDLRAIVKKRG